MHSRNKKAMEFIAKGWSALKGVDRVIDYRELNDRRLIPLLSTAKENFELALEADNSNTHARYWLAKLHFKHRVPGKCPAVGGALLVEAANMRDPDAQYDLSCHLRVESFGSVIMMYFDHFTSDQPSFYYLEKAVDQELSTFMVLFIWLGIVWSEILAQRCGASTGPLKRGHGGAGIACGSILLRGIQVREVLLKFGVRRGRAAARKSRAGDVGSRKDPVEMARKQFEIAAKAGCDLGCRWLTRLDEEEKSALAT